MKAIKRWLWVLGATKHVWPINNGLVRSFLLRRLAGSIRNAGLGPAALEILRRLKNEA